MAEFDGVSEYLKAAIRRLEDAQELSQPPTLHPNRSDAETRHLRGAMYLAGYAIEFVLKAYITLSFSVQTLEQAIKAAPKSKQGLMKRLNGADGHNLRLLLSLTDLEPQMNTDRAAKRNWNLCLTWNVANRYNPARASAAEAKEFVEAVTQFFAWMQRRVG